MFAWSETARIFRKKLAKNLTKFRWENLNIQYIVRVLSTVQCVRQYKKYIKFGISLDRLKVQRQSGGFSESMVLLVGNGCLSVNCMANVVFHIFIATGMFELTFGRCKSSRPVMYFLPGFLSLKRDVWMPRAIQNCSTKNFEMRLFWYSTRNLVQDFLVFSCSILSRRNRTSTQQNNGFGMNLGPWIYVGFLWC